MRQRISQVDMNVIAADDLPTDIGQLLTASFLDGDTAENGTGGASADGSKRGISDISLSVSLGCVRVCVSVRASGF